MVHHSAPLDQDIEPFRKRLKYNLFMTPDQRHA